MKIGFITLGCDKNTVDTERYLAQLAAYGGEHTDDLSQAEVIVVNTCGFIDAAKKESIDAILEASRQKVEGACQAVVALGCMVQRHKNELAEAIPRIRRVTDLPIAIGFGVRSPAQAASAVLHADAAVVASALIDTLKNDLDADGRAGPGTVEKVLDQVRALAQGVRKARVFV